MEYKGKYSLGVSRSRSWHSRPLKDELGKDMSQRPWSIQGSMGFKLETNNPLMGFKQEEHSLTYMAYALAEFLTQRW